MSTVLQMDLLQHGLEKANTQLSACLAGISAADWNTKIVPPAMSAAEIAEHLCEVYVAFKKMNSGHEHEWGTYASGITDQDALLSHMHKLRAEACALAEGTDNPETAKAAIDYILGHDLYHVGQLVLIRMTTDSSWDPYSIYGGS